MEYLLKILELYSGNKTALARKLKKIRPASKITQAHISNWINRDKKIPDEWVIPLAQSSGWVYTPHQINKSLYPYTEDGMPRKNKG